MANFSNRSSEELIRPRDAGKIASAVTDWFRLYQRPLSFRQTRDPYAIMVYEFMLQQTTVAVVQPYFDRFMESFPSVGSLAMADEAKVMGHWAGLGYYRRARQLHAAAKVLHEEHGGEFPQDTAALMKLPGFGRYTAGSVVATAFDLPAPIVEANTVRVFARLAGIHGLIGEGAFTVAVWRVARQLVKRADSPRNFNMGAMELGALVCRPEPNCLVCPVQKHCIAFKRNEQRDIPQRRPKREKVNVDLVSLVVADSEGRFLIRRIAAGKWHAGLWEFPTFPGVRPDELDDEPVIESELGLEIGKPSPILRLGYTVTHHKVSCQVFNCRLKSITDHSKLVDAHCRFAPVDTLAEFPMGSAQSKIRTYIINQSLQ